MDAPPWSAMKRLGPFPRPYRRRMALAFAALAFVMCSKQARRCCSRLASSGSEKATAISAGPVAGLLTGMALRCGLPAFV